ncbi:MAG: lipid-A-disaccharide synthase [Planctomycetota bacterium]
MSEGSAVRPKRVLLSVGDDSGDLHAANLMRAMRDLDGGLRFVGFGMAKMAEAGLEAIEGTGAMDGAMWLHNVLRLGRFRRRLAGCRRLFDAAAPDLVIPVDFGGFNLCLCREAARRGIPVFYYIPPQVWAHGRYRLRKLKKWTTRVGLIYPFEVPLYERHGVAADYVGHPLFDELQRRPPAEDVVLDLRNRFGASLIGVFPGSRQQEVRGNLPVMLEGCRRIRDAVRDASFAICCTERTRPVVQGILPGAPAKAHIADGVRPVELARASRICITKSGTTTLEIASQQTPMVVFHRVSALVAFFAYGLSHTPYVSLVNVLAGRRVCPERPTVRAEPAWVADQALRLLRDAEAYAACREGMRRALSGYAEPGASLRAARSALALLDGP